jgi:hypothetical protein
VHEIEIVIHPANDEPDDSLAPTLEWALAQAILEAMKHKKAAGSNVTKNKTNLRHGEGA